MFRRGQDEIEVLLVHPGGPYWANKDEGVWTIPKGEPADGEEDEYRDAEAHPYRVWHSVLPN